MSYVLANVWMKIKQQWLEIHKLEITYNFGSYCQNLNSFDESNK